MELQRISNTGELKPELLEEIQMINMTLNGLKNGESC